MADLLERESAIRAVEASVRRACDGAGSALFIVGEAGLGKTSLLAHASRLARGAGMDVGSGRGEQMEGALPFGLMAQVLDSLDPAALDETLTGAPATEQAAPYYRTLRWAKARRGRPLLIVVDDLQWSDPDSLGLLAFLVRRLNGRDVAVIGALRPWPAEADECVRGLVEGGDAAVERLVALSAPAAAAFLTARVGTPVDADTELATWELCRGNPFLVEQVAGAIARGEPMSRTMPAGRHPEHLLLARFAGLDRAGLACAQAACVLGTSFSPATAGEVARLDEGSVAIALDGLWRSGLIDEDGAGTMRFSHPLLAQALYADLGPASRRSLHGRCFEALVARGQDAEACDHAALADLALDTQTLSVLTGAGRAALRTGAVASAIRILDTAARLGGDRSGCELMLARTQALAAAGRMGEAAQCCRDLLAHPALGWSDRVETLRLLGRALYLTGAPDFGDAALSDAVDEALRNDPERAVQPLLDQSLAAWMGGGPRLALPLAVRARALAAGAGRAMREQADAVWGHLALESGDVAGLAATRPVAQRMGDHGPEADLDPAELTWPWATPYHHALNSNFAERHDDAVQTLELIRATVERAGAATALATLAIFMTDVRIRQGRLTEALRESDRAKELSDLTPGVVPYAEVAGAEALLWLGRGAESESACARAEASAGGQWFIQMWVAHVRGLRLLWEGDLRSSRMFCAVEELVHRTGIGEPCHLQWAGHAVAAHLAAGEIDAATRVVEWLEACAPPLPCTWPRSAACLGRARLAWHAGDDTGAEDLFQEALSFDPAASMPLPRAEALLAYGGFLRRRGGPVAARPLLAEAIRLAEASGATTLLALGRAELAAAGGRRRRPAPDGHLLTPAETSVAALAAGGSSNAEIARTLFLSVNTVETHLKRVYAKAGIKSRQQLSALEQLRDAADPA